MEYVEDIATNYVLAQYLGGVEITAESDIKIEKGTGVVLKVGVSPDQNLTTVPRLIGRKLFDAKGKLWEQGLNVGQIVYDDGINLLTEDDARVCYQSAMQTSELKLGESVSIRLTLDKEAVDAAAEKAEKALKEMAKQRELADSLARIEADSLRMLQAVEPQPEQAEDEFFF